MFLTKFIQRLLARAPKEEKEKPHTLWLKKQIALSSRESPELVKRVLQLRGYEDTSENKVPIYATSSKQGRLFVHSEDAFEQIQDR